jgi:hypothetical protein
MKIINSALLVVLSGLAFGCQPIPPDRGTPPDPNPELDSGSAPELPPDGPGAPDAGNLPSEMPDPIDEPNCDVPEPIETPLRRLTRTEYDNSIRDLLGDDSRVAEQTFVPDSAVTGFPVATLVGEATAEDIRDAAEEIAARAVENLDTLLPCDPANVDPDLCAQAFVEGFAPRAYRRPLTDSQLAGILGVYSESRDAGDVFRDRIRLVVTAILQSPFFLYRVEVGSPTPHPDAANVVPLDGYDIASRLSYLLWNSMPDQALLDAAAAGALQTADEIEAQARRLLSAPRARKAVADFFMRWFEVDRVLDVIKDEEHPSSTRGCDRPCTAKPVPSFNTSSSTATAPSTLC